MQYKVKKNTKIPYAVAIVCAALSVAFMYTGSFGIGNTMMYQVMMLILAAAAVYMLIRYALTDMIYVIFDEKPYTLEIVKLCGKLPKTIAVIEMTADDKLVLQNKDDLSQKTEKIKKKENFCANMFPKEKYLYIANTENGRVSCSLELEKDVAKILFDRIEELRLYKNIQQN